MFGILLQVSFLEQFLQKLSEKNIVYTILVIAIAYLVWRLHNKEKEISEQQKQIRENEKENLEILNQVSATLDRVIEGQRTTNDMIFRELQNLKEYIKLSFDSSRKK